MCWQKSSPRICNVIYIFHHFGHRESVVHVSLELNNMKDTRNCDVTRRASVGKLVGVLFCGKAKIVSIVVYTLFVFAGECFIGAFAICFGFCVSKRGHSRWIKPPKYHEINEVSFLKYYNFKWSQSFIAYQLYHIKNYCTAESPFS